MDINDYLKSKKENKNYSNKANYLYKVYSGLSYSFMPQNIGLFGIYILGFDLYDDETNYPNVMERREFQKSKMVEIATEYELKGFKKNIFGFKKDPLFDLFVYIWGRRKGKLIRSAWDSFKDYPYQTGYYRRSFRAPESLETINLRRINFLKTLLKNQYNLSMEESVIYDINIGYQNFSIEFLWVEDIKNGNHSLYRLLLDIVYSRSERGQITRRIIKALLLINREDGIKAVGELLLAAQREEGLRQTILECLDETTPEAMLYFLKLIDENNLIRFSSVVRAIDVWAGLNIESKKGNFAKNFLSYSIKFLENPDTVDTIIESDNSCEIYSALWAISIINVENTLPLLKKLYESGKVEKQTLVMLFITNCNFKEFNHYFVNKALESKHLEVFYHGLSLFEGVKPNGRTENNDLFNYLVGRIEDIPKKGVELDSKCFNWYTYNLNRDMLFFSLISLAKRNREFVDKLFQYMDIMPVNPRSAFVSMVLPGFNHWEFKKNKLKPIDKKQREFAFGIINDRSSSIRDIALNAIKTVRVEIEEAEKLETLLKSKNSNLRKSVIDILLKSLEEKIKPVIERLLKSKNGEQRLAGLDILNRLNADAKNKDYVLNQVEEYKVNNKSDSKEDILIKNITNTDSENFNYTKDNGYGLYDVNKISKTTDVTPINDLFQFSMPIKDINNQLEKLHNLFLENTNHEYVKTHFNGSSETVLLGNDYDINLIDDYENVPLWHVWDQWFKESQLTNRDLFIISILGSLKPDEFYKKCYPKSVKYINNLIPCPNILPLKEGRSYFRRPGYCIISSLLKKYKQEEYWKDLESIISRIYMELDRKEIKNTYENRSVRYYRSTINIFKHPVIDALYDYYSASTTSMDDIEFTQYWKLDKWRFNYYISVTTHGREKTRPSLFAFCRAYELKLINDDELYYGLIDENNIEKLSDKNHGLRGINLFERFRFLQEKFDNVRDRVLEIELSRGDSSTPVSKYAFKVMRLYGAKNLAKILKGLGKDNIFRGYIYSWSNERNKQIIFSSLLKRCYPDKNDNQEDFNTLFDELKLKDKRIIEVALYSPQWVDYINNYLGWKGLDSAIWWFHAHTNAIHNSETEAKIARYSPIRLPEYSLGSVDIEWFHDAYKNLGDKKWDILYKSAKYISEGNGHSRAKLYADVLQRKISEEDILNKIKDKRNQDYLRVYGLLSVDGRKKGKDILDRYQYIQQFKKESKQFGAQRQASEKIAISVATENLARAGGYPDPIRLTWAMETKEAESMLGKGSSITIDNITVSLVVNSDGSPEILVIKDDKKLKSIPAKLKKNKNILEIKERLKVLRNQYRRAKVSLEEAMIRGDVFETKEFNTLLKHPVISPLLSKLVIVSNSFIGFYKSDIEIKDSVKIAHTYDLYHSGRWKEFQNDIFSSQNKQPFKQVFRELYIPTEDELLDGVRSKRYAGNQIQVGKTVALLRGRGWTVDHESGLQKVYHKEEIIITLYAMADWFTPADVEAPTIEFVEFSSIKKGVNVKINDIPPVLFSEVMRDLDLVVSIAHAGKVDPEASHSTVEMRNAILTETINLYKLDNVKIKGSHAFIEGNYAKYSVHLGSGVIHKEPGIHISVIPVHSQHRGRIFLPFLDNDPKTSEITAKVLMLSRDNKIKDPKIVEQIVSAV